MTPLLIILSLYAAASLITFGAFALDKWRARNEKWRIPEATLHLMELLGGWPGAFAAMLIVRHKNRKLSFVLITIAIALVHAGAWAAYFLRDRILN